MSGYISRSKLIKDVENLKDCYNGFSDTYDKACIIGLIAEQPSIEEPQKPKWIPVAERLPDNQCDVLCDDEGRVVVGYYTDKEIGWHDLHSYQIYPTHWMPLPQPPKDGET